VREWLLICALGASGCADFAGSECTVLALCDDGTDAGVSSDVTLKDMYVPFDAPLVEGSVPDGFTMDGACTGDCVDVPAGWTGPVALWEATSGPAPACTGAYTGAATDVNSGLTAPAAQCSMCGCTSPTGQTCTATVNIYEGGSCTVTPCATVTVSGSGCTGYGPCGTDGDPASYQSGQYSWAVSGGSCTHSGGTPTLPAVSWSTTARTCAYNAATGGTCASGTCYAPATAPFGGACVYQTGDVMCPSGFTNQHVFYASDTDTRGCSVCGCGAPSGSSCTGSVSYWHNTLCSDFPVSTTIPEGVCASTYTYYYDGQSVEGALGVSGGSCTASGGQPQGTATPASPMTVCCQ